MEHAAIIDKAIAAAGGVTPLARQLGLSSPSAVTNWRRVNRIPVPHMRAVAELADVPLHLVAPDLWPPPAEEAA